MPPSLLDLGYNASRLDMSAVRSVNLIVHYGT